MAKKKIVTSQGLSDQLDDFPLVGDGKRFDEFSERVRAGLQWSLTTSISDCRAMTEA